jgi:hypothetical protein
MRGENNPMYGKNPWDYMTEETKRKISEDMSVKYSGKNNPNAKVVVCLTTKRVFFTAKEGAKYYGCSVVSVRRCCARYKDKNGYITNTAGKLPDGTKLVWRYLVWKHDKKYRIKK